MKEAEIIERNKQIAIMLGWIDKDGDLIIPIHLSNGTDYREWADTKEVKRDDLYTGCVLYHYINVTQEGFSSNYNWLMEALNFIENLGYTTSITMNFINIMFVNEGIGITISSQNGPSKKEAIFIAVSDFAKKFNNNELKIYNKLI